MRALGRASSSGGKGKDQRIKYTTKEYLTKAKALLEKLEKTKGYFPIEDITDMIIANELERFMELLEKHIDIFERRVIKLEQIPHEEKMFSIFEQYTEWIMKGKLGPNVELGKKVCVTTDQYNLNVNYHIMEQQSDSEILIQLADKLLSKYKIGSWSFDKGFWSKGNKELLSKSVKTLVLPKRGKWK